MRIGITEGRGKGKSLPMEPSPFPIDASSVPVDRSFVPIDPGSVPIDPSPIPIDPSPMQDDPTPVQDDLTPVQDDPSPVQVDPTPVQGDPTPVQDDPTPVQMVLSLSPEGTANSSGDSRENFLDTATDRGTIPYSDPPRGRFIKKQPASASDHAIVRSRPLDYLRFGFVLR